MGLEPNAWILSSRVSFSPVFNVTFCFEFASFSGGSFPSGDKSPEIGSGFTISLQGGWVYLIIPHISRCSNLLGTRTCLNQYFLAKEWNAVSGSVWMWCCCSVAQPCPILCDPLDSMPGFPVLCYLPGFAQTHVHWISDAIQPSHPLPLSYPFAFNLSQHQGLFQWVGCSHQVAQVLGASALASLLPVNI